MQQKHIFILSLCFFLFCEWGISQKTEAQNTEIASWLTAKPAGNGFLEKPLEQSIEKIGAMKGVYGVLVVRNGYLTYEKYFREGTQTKPHNLKSASKSVLSALVGIAIDKGLLRKEQFISDFFPFIKTLPDPRKRLITVQHLLNMTSGLQSMSYQAYNSWIINENWLTKLLKLPIVFEPGTKHQYSTGDTHILSAVLTAATGMSTKEFAEKHLFSPLHIKIKGWEIDPQGIYQGGNNLSLYPRDMARFGQLYLDNGKAAGQQIIPEAWVKESTSPLQPDQHKVYGGYGYLWYSHPGGENAFVAVGYGGQYIFVSPEHNAVVVIISTLYSKGEEWEATMFNHIQHGILASIHNTSGAPFLGQKGPSTSTHSELEPNSGIATAKLNLRKGPGIKNSIITTIEPGSIFEIIDQNKSWLHVTTAQQKGWVASKFVHIVQPENLAIAKPLSKKSQQETTVAPQNNPTKLVEIDQEVLSNYHQLQHHLDMLRLGLDQTESNYNTLNDIFFASQDQYKDELTKNQKGIETLSTKLSKRIESIDQKIEIRETESRKIITELKKQQTDLRNDFSKTEAASQKKSDQIAKLITTDKQLRLNQAETNNEIQILQSDFSAKETQLNEIATNAKKETSQIKKTLSAIEKRVTQQEEALGKTHTSIATYNDKLRQEIDREKLYKDQLLTDLNALQITLRSMIDENETIRKNLSAYQNKNEIVHAQISSLENELEKQRQSNEVNYGAISEYNSRLAKIEKNLLLLQTSKDSEEIPLVVAQKKTSTRLPEPDQPTLAAKTAPKAVKNIELIAPFINSWSNAWSSQNVEEFLLHYSENFTPSKGLSLKKWKQNRHRNIKKPKFIRLTISDMKKQMLDQNNAKVVFRQSYKSNTYSDKVTKTILLKWQNSQWKIVKETSK